VGASTDACIAFLVHYVFFFYKDKPCFTRALEKNSAPFVALFPSLACIDVALCL
jgi:hypothetical protein